LSASVNNFGELMERLRQLFMCLHALLLAVWGWALTSNSNSGRLSLFWWPRVRVDFRHVEALGSCQ